MQEDEQAHKESLAAEAIKFAEEADGSDDDDDEEDDDEVHKEYLTNMEEVSTVLTHLTNLLLTSCDV